MTIARDVEATRTKRLVASASEQRLQQQRLITEYSYTINFYFVPKQACNKHMTFVGIVVKNVHSTQ